MTKSIGIHTAATDSITKDRFGVMIASKSDGYRALPLDKVAGRRKAVPIDHPWIAASLSLGICMGDGQ